jgi:hypothetical protein
VGSPVARYPSACVINRSTFQRQQGLIFIAIIGKSQNCFVGEGDSGELHVWCSTINQYVCPGFFLVCLDCWFLKRLLKRYVMIVLRTSDVRVSGDRRALVPGFLLFFPLPLFSCGEGSVMEESQANQPDQPFVATETKKQRKKKREKEKKRVGATSQIESDRAVKLLKPSPLAAIDNAAYAAVFGPDARGSVVLKPEYTLAANRFHLNPTHLQLLVGVAAGELVNHSTSPFVLGHQALIKRVVVVSMGGVTLDMVNQSVSTEMQSMFVFGHSIMVGPGSANKVFGQKLCTLVLISNHSRLITFLLWCCGLLLRANRSNKL